MNGIPETQDSVRINALEFFNELQSAFEKKNLVLFLDYDGTLSPIVELPDQAFIPEKMREILGSLSNVFPTIIVSGRSVEKVSSFLNLDGLLFAGSHGFDIQGISRGETIFYRVATQYLPSLGAIRDSLTARLINIPGATVEDNVYSITVHYRNCTKENVQEVKAIVSAEKAKFEDLVITKGKKVLEVRPNLVWHKGKAVQWILENQQMIGDDYVSIYIGDDQTDEDVFQTFKENPNLNGLGIAVMDQHRCTHATYSLRNTAEVEAFLSLLLP